MCAFVKLGITSSTPSRVRLSDGEGGTVWEGGRLSGERPARRREGDGTVVKMIRDGEVAGSRVCGAANARDEIGRGDGAGFALGPCCTDDGADDGVPDLGGEGVDLAVLASDSSDSGSGRTFLAGAVPI